MTLKHTPSFLYFRQQGGSGSSYSHIKSAAPSSTLAVEWICSLRGPTCCKGPDLWHSVSSFAARNAIPLFSWCAYCLFLAIFNHVLVFLLGGTYLPFNHDRRAWLPSEECNTYNLGKESFLWLGKVSYSFLGLD